jgi:hypothetical protein
MTIEKQFALVLAGQVSAGLIHGDNELGRARAALTAIGLMVLNASGRDPDVAEQLAISDHATATVDGDSVLISYVPEGNGEE